MSPLLLPEGARLAIGGVEIAFSAPAGSRLRIASPLYRPFVARGVAQAGGERMTVRLMGDIWPSLDGMSKVFDTGDSWSLFRAGPRYRLVLAPGKRRPPLWLAGFGTGAGRVDLHFALPAPGRAGRRLIDLPFVYPLDQLVLMHYFARRRGLLVHGAGMKLGGRIFLLAGASGAGKSTISQLLAGAGLGRMLSDERMVVRRRKGEWLAFGTPWAGTAEIARPGSGRLAGIFFLRHGSKNEIEEVPAAAAADRLLAMASVPWYDPDAAARVVALAKGVCAAVPCREFRFTPDPAAPAFLKKHL